MIACKGLALGGGAGSGERLLESGGVAENLKGGSWTADLADLTVELSKGMAASVDGFGAVNWWGFSPALDLVDLHQRGDL